MVLLIAFGFLLRRISSFSILLPVILSAVFFKRLNKPFKILAGLLYVSTLIQVISILMTTYGTTLLDKYTLFFYHILIIIEFTLLTTIYKIEFKDFVPAKFFSGLIIFFVLFSVTNTVLVMEPFHSIPEFFRNFRYIARFNSYAQLLEDFLLMSFALFYFYKLMKELKVENLEKEAFFWFNIGILIYFSSKFTLDIFSNFIKSASLSLKNVTWSVHSVANILLHLFYSLAIWRNSRK